MATAMGIMLFGGKKNKLRASVSWKSNHTFLLCGNTNMFPHRRNLNVHVAIGAFYRGQHSREIGVVGHDGSIYAEAAG